jgi:hypothetical protein
MPLKEPFPVPVECIGDDGPLEKPTTNPVRYSEKSTPVAFSESVLEKDAAQKRRATYQQVKALQSQGHGKKAIARHLHISRNTVRKYFLQEVSAPKPRVKRSNLLDFEAWDGNRA